MRKLRSPKSTGRVGDVRCSANHAIGGRGSCKYRLGRHSWPIAINVTGRGRSERWVLDQWLSKLLAHKCQVAESLGSLAPCSFPKRWWVDGSCFSGRATLCTFLVSSSLFPFFSQFAPCFCASCPSEENRAKFLSFLTRWLLFSPFKLELSLIGPGSIVSVSLCLVIPLSLARFAV